MSRLVRTTPPSHRAVILPRQVVVRAVEPVADDRCTPRVVELLARGLERLLTNQGCGREGMEEEQGPELDFPSRQSVTTQERTRPPIGEQR